MKIFFTMLVMISSIWFVGCDGGDGSNDEPVSNNSRDNLDSQDHVYKNKKLPVIKKDVIPYVLLVNSASSSKQVKKQSKEIGEVSSGFITLKEKANFFYKKQLEMNIELGYMDSIWDQIEKYCEEKQVCNIPSGKIVFIYTEALYNRNIKLIKEYEEKTKDYDTYSEYEYGLKSVIGKKLELESANLRVDESAKYKYELTTVEFGDKEMNPNIERSIVKWNDDNDNYFIREEVEGVTDGKSNGKPNWTQYEYIETGDEKISKFVSRNNFLNYNNKNLEFREKEDGSIYFMQDNQSDDFTYHAEGSLNEEGGEITFSDMEGHYLYETFDSDGDILTTISCQDTITDPKNISDNSCIIQDTSIIKDILLNNIYSLSVPFWGKSDFSSTSTAEYHTMLKFDENDSLLAVVNCSTFVADYKIGGYGISFENIKKTISSDLKCLYPQIQINFEKVLKNGLPFMDSVDVPTEDNSHFNSAFGFFPNLDGQKRTDFNLDDFYKKLHSSEYVDSPLMKSVFEIKSVHEYFHDDVENYLLVGNPQIKVENKKIMIDLIDATFDAEIEVVDATHIRFTNINRVNKSNVTYPDDINSTCQEENLGTKDECFEDPYSDNTNSDKIFADIIENFLSEIVEVYSGVTGYARLTFVGSELSFNGWTN